MDKPTVDRLTSSELYESNLAVMVLDRARRSPNSVAAAIPGEIEITYAELGERVAVAAAVLAGQGIAPGDRVAFAADNSVEIIDYLAATLALGAVFVPLNTRLSPSELSFIVTDAQCRVVVADAGMADHLAPVRDELGATLVGLAATDDLPWGWASATELAPGEVAALRNCHPTSPHDPAIFMYTSGTTGLPKGVMISHDNMLACIRNLALIVTFGSDCGMLAMTPIFHVAAMALILGTVATGGRTVILRSFSPDGFYDAMAAHPVTFTFGVPAMLQMLAADERFERTDLSNVFIMCAGAPVPPALLEQYLSRGAKVTQGYGLTESTGTVSLLDPGMSREKIGSAGLPFPMTAVEIRDADGNPIDEPGVDGEIWAKGRSMVSGYWNRPEATAELHDEDGWLRTGDAGRFDEDGYLYITDRVKDMIITGGENVFPAEVEKALAHHPAIAEVAVIGLPDERWGEAVSAVVVPRDGATVELDDVQSFAREHLGGYKVPRRLHLVDALPRNASGKVLKRELRTELAGDN